MPEAWREEARRTVQELVCQVLQRKKSELKPEDIKEGLSLTRDLGIDSFDILQLSAVVEKRYKIKIPEEDLPKLDDLGDILKTIERYRQAAP